MTEMNAKHIMIVEDSPDLQMLLGRLFASEGYTIHRADNGQQALDLLHSMPSLPDTILLDIMMPVMDGIDFRNHQKNDPQLAKIPVVVMTADSNYQTHAKSLGDIEIIKKPILDIHSLIKTIERAQARGTTHST